MHRFFYGAGKANQANAFVIEKHIWETRVYILSTTIAVLVNKINRTI